MNNIKICVIGLGYVGLPLARLFSIKYETIGFDMNQARVDALNTGHDATLEVSDEILQEAINNHGFRCTTNIDDIKSCNFYIVAVPTPVDENNRPDLKPLWGASETVGKVISNGDIVVYESTVYPGVTEEECIPVIEKFSGLKFNVDFFAGYSPERINPGDKEHTVEKIKKVTSGSTPEIADIMLQLMEEDKNYTMRQTDSLQRKILVVDDEEMNHKMLSHIMKDEPRYEIVAVKSGHDALKALNRERFDLILLDVMMPEMDGLETLRHIRKIYNTPVVLMSGNKTLEAAADFAELGCNDYISKPFLPLLIKEVVHNMTERTQIRQ